MRRTISSSLFFFLKVINFNLVKYLYTCTNYRKRLNLHKLVKLIYMKNCVNTSHKEFKELARKLDIDDSSLELIIYKFQNADPNNVNVFPSEEYIRSKLTGVNYASSKAQKELWKKVYNKDFKFNSSEELNKAIETAKKYFNSEAITVWKNREGNYVMRVADPKNIKEDLYEKELQDILAKAPRDKEGRLLAPNGKLSNLTERQYAQVRTKAFKEWFGDWENDPQNASKVIDKNGEPLVVYHGSPIVTIDKFDLENSIGLQLRDNEGFTISNTAWFTPQERIAKNTYSVKPESLGKGEAAVEYGKVYPVFLNIRTPLVDGLKNAQEHLEWWGSYVTADEKVQDFIKRVYQRASKENTDGFILTFEDIDQDTPSYHSLQTQFGIVNADQVKSADANIGSFSKEDDNIFFNKDVSTIYDLLQYLHTKLHYSTKKSGVTEVKRIISRLHDVYYVSKFDSEKALEDLEKYREKYLLPKGIFKVKSSGKNKIISVDTEVLKDAIERNQNNQNFGDLFSSAEEAIRVREVLDFLSAKTGLKYTTISESEAIKLLNKSKKKLGSTNAFIHNNVCYFIQGRKLNVDIASEEMLHPFINAMYNQNRMLFDNLLKESMIRFPKLRLEIAESYKEESEDVRYQELVTQALSRAFREERTSNPTGNSISNIIKYFLDFVKDLFSAGNKDYILLDELKADITLEDLSKIINTELKLLYNSNFGDITRFNRSKEDITEYEESDTLFTISKSTGYRERTIENAEWSDITLALAVDFTTAGEKLTKKSAGKKYVNHQLAFVDVSFAKQGAEEIFKDIKRKKLPTKNIKLNIAGNGIYSLDGFMTQDEINDYTTSLLKELMNLGVTISSIRSGGQTGADEAGIIAAQRLGIPNEVHTTKDWKFRGADGKDIKDETAFKSRFQNNKSYNISQNKKTYSGLITSLKPNQIFVFGSNTQGRHGAGAAKTARDKFGAKYGQAEGIQGQSYAIITKDLTIDDKKNPSRTKEQIIEQIHGLYEYAKQHSDKEFLVAYSKDGKNLNYYSSKEMAKMFASKDIPSNIIFEEGFYQLVEDAQEELRLITEQLNKSKNLVAKIISDSKENIKKHPNFDKEDVEGSHTYLIKQGNDWIPADSSVTQLVHGNINLGGWRLPSMKLGNTTDRFVRRYFELPKDKKDKILKEYFPNLTKEQALALKEDLDKLSAHFEEKFNGNWGVETREFPIAGKYAVEEDGKLVYKTVAGTMDMLVYDGEGNFYIYDFKTVRSNLNNQKLEGYYQQLSIYKAILEANYPELKGKIKEMDLIRFSLYYETPIKENGTMEYEVGEEDEDKDILLVYDESIDDKHYIPIEDTKWYKAPRLYIGRGKNSGVHKAFYSVPEITLSQQFKSLTEEEKLFSEEFKKEINENYPNIDEVNIQVDSLYNNPLLTATERMFLANTVMYYSSNIITHLQSNPEANHTYLGDSYSRYDFTSMSRREIIETVNIDTIFKYIKETYFNSSVRDDIEDWNLLDKLDIAYNNWEALTRSAYSKLVTLEGVTVTRTAPEYITKEGIEDSLMESQDTGALEENEREYWQLGIRHISTKSSLSNEVRRVFERLVVTDQNGNPILDKYGYNFHTFVDSNEAVNKILDWCQDCTTIEEMEESIRNMAESNPWVNGILEKLQEEPFRSQFFQNFRKDFTQYSIITVDTDSKGNRVYKVLNINTKGASKVILDGVTTAYKEGLLTNIIIPIKGDIEGRGKVNVKEVESLGKSVKSVSKKLHSSFGTTNFNKTLNSQIPEVVKILNKLGVSINIQTLKDAFSKDGKFKNEPNTTYFKVLSNIEYLLDTLLENKGNNEYNPLEKGGEGNIYGNYKNIVTVLSKYIQDSVEASTYENGKMHYSFVTPSYMGKLITNLKDALGNEVKFKKFMQEEYKQYRWFYDGQWNNEWLRLLNTSGEMRQKLEHKVQLSFDGTPYNELSELGYTLSLMHEYFYDNAGKKNLAWYRVPILANKPSSEFIRFKRYSGSRYQRDIINGLSMVANQEIMRIKTVLERSQNPNIQKIGVKEKATYDIKDGILNSSLNKKIQKRTLTFNDIIKNGQSIFKGSGAEFKFLPALNQEILNKTTLGQLILDKINGKDVNESLFEKEFNSAIKSYMKTMVAREINNWRQLGLFDTIETKTKVKGKNITNVEYIYLKQFGKTEEEILDALEEYVWNDMFATINIIQLTATDLAYYKNIEDFQKRYAQVHSPALRLNVAAKDSKGNLYSKDGKERTIYLKDFLVTSEIIPQVTAVFDNKISKLSGVEKQHMKMMKDLIIESFKKVNVADAQGYSSPTSYRKKMGMAGRWTTDMEEAYQRICKGDFNVNDLGIVWQPLKPFVYSQIPKSTGAQTMNKIKLAVQNKNSEYLLILADALMRGGNQVSKLTAIFDFMEDSAYDGRVSKDGKVIKEGVYNGIGIDTIQFESAVNSGSMGAIDINNLDSYNAIKEQLNRHVYYNSDHSESSDNDMDRYNDQFVHTISFEDYGIQQEVPAHLVDHEQPMGSQIRILSISDITPGTKFNVNGELIDDKKLVKEYQDLIAENIKDSFKQLAKDFNITGTRIEKNIALSKLLIEAIENDQRYGADLRRACSLNPITKEFNIPLNDPIQSIRIQQLINSIIKTRINKQKVPGGPVVQASVFGMSDDLKIVWKDKKKGIVDYFECYMPIPSMELEKALTKYDENGHAYFMSIEEAIKKGIITEEMTKAIGYRIPTEDKYSMAPLKIKGFLPKAAGEAIMLPKEITTLAGSDFDIDKMYIMLKAFKVNKPKADFELIENAFKSYLTSQGKKTKEISNYIYGNKNTGESSIREYISKIESGVSFNITTPKETRVDEKGLAIERWYNANKDRIYTQHSFVEEVSLETREGRTNRIFDLQWAVLTNEDTMDKLFNPGSFEVQKKSARIVNILKHNGKKYTYKELASKKLEDLDSIIENQNDKSIIFSSTQVYFHKQNMTAGKLIGIFANNNTSHAFLSLQDISFNVDNEFMFNGFHVNNEQNNRLDLLRGKDGSLISKTIAGFLAASVDAVKDPVLNYMNLNTFTAGPAMVLARLGFNSDSIGLFLSQPIIESVTREYFKRSNEGYVSISDIIDDFLPEDPKLIKGIKASLSSTPFTMEDMAKGITLGDTSTNFQQSVLVLFKQLSEMAQDLNTLTFITKFNSITNAVGPTIADTLVMRERYEKFIDNMNSDNPPFTINAKYVLENSPILEAFYNTTLSDGGASKLIFQEYFPHYSSMFTQVLQAIRKNTKGNLDSKIINKLVNDFILYKMTIGEDPVLNADESNRKKYMIDFPQYFIQRTSNIIDNDLLKIINLKARDYKCPVPTLEAETGGYSIDVQERVKAGWGNLVINPETKELGRDLLYYNIFRSGFNFSPKTFGHLASVDVKLNIPGYVSILQDVEFNDALFNIENFIYMFLRNHTDSSKLVPELRINKNIEVSYSNNSTGEDVVTISYNDESGINSILTSNEDIPVFAKVISINDDIYMNPIVRLDSVVYTKTTTLGITNNFLEYDGNSSANMSSIFKSKQVIKKAPSKSSPIEEDRKNNYVKLKDVEAVLQKELGLKEYQLYKAQPASERQGFINKIVTLTLQQVNVNTKNENLREVIRKKVEDRLKQLNVC